MNFLYSLPDSVIVLIFTFVMAGSMVLVGILKPHVALFNPGRTPDETKKIDDFLIAIRATIIAMCSFVLAFSLVTVINNFNKTDAAAGAEAALINNMDRMLLRYGDPSVAALRAPLHAYAKSVVNDEWPLLKNDGRSDKTRRLFAPVSQGILAIKPEPGRQTTIYAEMIKKADDIAEAREARLDNTGTALAQVFWLMVTIAFGSLIILPCFIELNTMRIFGLAVQMAAFGALLSVVFIFDHPFKGETSVSPAAMIKVIDVMETRKE